MMARETDDAFERAADTEYRWQTRRKRRKSGQGPLVIARASFHSTLNGFVFLAMTFALHLFLVQRATNWVIAHGVIVALTFLGLVSAWGDQRIAEAALREREARE